MNLLQRLAGGVLAVVFLVLALVFASVIFAVVAVLALVAWGWLMWRTRDARRIAREQGGAQPRGGPGARPGNGAGGGSGTVIEGEYRVEREVRRLDDDTR